MKLIKDYFELQKKIFDHFGYVEDWVAIPLEDQTDSHWLIVQNEHGGGQVCYSPDPLTRHSIEAGVSIYSNIIYTQRFLPKWVYRADDYTMICVDTQTDGNKFLSVFDNKKECHDESLKQIYMDRWG